MQSTLAPEWSREVAEVVAQLNSGDRMSQAEFHELYEQAPEDFRAELIGGIVYVSSTGHEEHEAAHLWLSAILLTYQLATIGLEVCSNATVILNDDAEPQPDLLLRRLPQFGGISTSGQDGYIQGPVELVIEIAHSKKSIDLHAKRNDYRRYGVPEYLVYVLDEKRLRWFDLEAGKELRPEAETIFKIRRFPGLWIDEAALVTNNRQKMISILQRGLCSHDHRNFVQELAMVSHARAGNLMHARSH
jgi:Uma2 family endonuclease